MNEIRKYINIVENILNEKHYTGPLYHATRMSQGMQILKDGYFLLASASSRGSIEIEMIPKKSYIYYLSTSRSLINYFFNSGGGASALDLVFTLNPQFYTNNNCIIRPVNYFSELGPRAKELEERIWSKTNEISTKGITHCNLYNGAYPNPEKLEEQFTELCNKQGIKFHSYDDYDDFKVLKKTRI